MNSRKSQVAKDFGVEPVKLLSHVLIFDISLDSLAKILTENNFDKAKKNTDYIDDTDRKISVALRRKGHNSIVNEVLTMLGKYGENNFDEAKAQIIAYLNSRSKDAEVCNTRQNKVDVLP